MNLYWISWYEDDFPPNRFPYGTFPIWQTGCTEDQYTFCAYILAENKADARTQISNLYGTNIKQWRFCNPRTHLLFSQRFPWDLEMAAAWLWHCQTNYFFPEIKVLTENKESIE